MARNSLRRSLTNVRTHTTRRTTPTLAKHELYMKLTSLEIERARRVTDRNATLDRVKLIDERIEAITAEQEEISRLLNNQPEQPSIATRAAVPRKNQARMNLKY